MKLVIAAVGLILALWVIRLIRRARRNIRSSVTSENAAMLDHVRKHYYNHDDSARR